VLKLAKEVQNVTRAEIIKYRYLRRGPAQTDIFITRGFLQNEWLRVVHVSHFFIIKLSMKTHEWLSDQLARHILDLGLDLID
jgi:hypothetical protein